MLITLTKLSYQLVTYINFLSTETLMPNGLFPAPINFFLLLLKSNIKILLLSGLAIYAILFFSSKSIPAGFFPPLNDEIILYFSSSIKSILFVN